MAAASDRCRAGAFVGAVALACAAVLVPPAALASVQEPGRGGLSLRVGGDTQRVRVCGRPRNARIVDRGSRAFVRAAATPRRGVLILRLRRCGLQPKRSRVLAKRSLGRRPVRLRAPLPTGAVGRYRLTVEVRRGTVRARRVAYLRVRKPVTPRDPVVDLPVTFDVTNLNRSRLACQSDGKQYTVAGRLVAPRGRLGQPSRAATLYLHEFGWGRFFWQFPGGGDDYAREMARAGHVSVVIDRLGYDASSHPPGLGSCLGAQADIAHQIVQQLRSGSYASQGSSPVGFERVALAGHSGGGAIAEIEAYSFGAIDGLVLFAYADQGFSARSLQEANEQGLACATGGEPAEPGQPGGYAYFAQTDDEWKSFMFTTAPDPVASAAAALRNRDPCGDTNSFTPAVSLNNVAVPEVDSPVLLLYGTGDAIYDQPAAGEGQRTLFSGSEDVTLEFFEGAGHALTLESQAPEVGRVVAGWLGRHGL